MLSKARLMIPSPNIDGTFAMCPGLGAGAPVLNITVSAFPFLLSHGATRPGARHCAEGI